MATKKGKGPAPLDPKTIKKLLDGLTTDTEFRRKFRRNAKTALESIGYVAPTDGSAHAGQCLQLLEGTSLASKDKIAAARGKLEKSLNAIQDFDCPLELQTR